MCIRGEKSDGLLQKLIHNYTCKANFFVCENNDLYSAKNLIDLKQTNCGRGTKKES